MRQGHALLQRRALGMAARRDAGTGSGTCGGGAAASGVGWRECVGRRVEERPSGWVTGSRTDTKSQKGDEARARARLRRTGRPRTTPVRLGGRQ